MTDQGRGTFWLKNGSERIGEMKVLVQRVTLTAYHTEVYEGYAGQGLAGKLLDAMLEYVRDKGLKVKPLCPYVHRVFQKNPEKYADVWSG
ncbi:GNAT family N-acetyltransferase [Dyadobacter tibetensis]|uniref:GNAT family N-acetyltransferase n=1 Tax=Dyadobacter tibetensis TaxID=1211851 RepID=UPI0004B55D8A|nr:GNAT family N-acetyltransferase [Dyadobacter tibetensis]